MSILGNAIEDLFSSGGFLDFGFREHGPPEGEASTSGRDSDAPPIDVEAVKQVYDKILKLYDTEVGFRVIARPLSQCFPTEHQSRFRGLVSDQLLRVQRASMQHGLDGGLSMKLPRL